MRVAPLRLQGLKPSPSNERRTALRAAVAGLLTLAAATLALLVASALLGGNDLGALARPLQWLAALQRDTTSGTLANGSQVVAGVLGIAITVVAIVLQLAASRAGARITEMFIREPVNRVVMSLFVLTALQCLWISVTLGDAHVGAAVPNAGFALTMALITLSMLVLLPYFVFVFSFLSPLNVIEQLQQRAYRAMNDGLTRDIESAQGEVARSVNDLLDVARSAVDQNDRSAVIACVDAFAELLIEYQPYLQRLADEWFEVTGTVARDPDFVALAPASLAELAATRLWVEAKVLRQYWALMIYSVGRSRDAAELIAISSRRIGVAAAADHPELLTQCMRCFNSYLRTNIRANDMRNSMYVLDQYRLFAEAVLGHGRVQAVREIAGYLQYYGVFAHSVGQSFILVMAAFDIGQLIEAAAARESPVVDDLLTLLLDLDQEIKLDAPQDDTLLGVRQAQLQAAALFLERNEEARARRIVADLAGERPERLERLRVQLLSENRSQYWEFTSRGVNFDYMRPERRPHLATLFGWLAAP